MRPIFLFFAAALLQLSTYANGTGEIKGSVYDSLTGAPVAFANVYVEYGGSPIGSQTDIDGNFTIKPLEPGTYNLHIKYVGYKSKIVGGVEVSANKITFVKDIQLSSGIDLGPIVIVEHRDLINPEDPMAMPIKSDVILKLPSNKNIALMVASMTPGVYQKDEGQPLYFKGSRSDASGYYVDGVRVWGDNFQVPGSAVGEMVVYTGGVPARYGDLTGGVVVIETKSYFSLLNQYRMAQQRREILGEQ